MEKEAIDNKFDQISGIFSQFSEENKDKLLETAKGLLKVQREETASEEGRCPEKKCGRGLKL